MINKVPTTCVYCSCGCSICLNVEDGKVSGITLNENNPVKRDFVCPKIEDALRLIHHPGRLKTPLIRYEGNLYPAAWEEAFSFTAERLLEVKGRYGGRMTGFLGSAEATNEENFLLMKWARAGFGCNNIDFSGMLYHTPTLTALTKVFGIGAVNNSIEEIMDAEVILVIGSDITEENPLVGNLIGQSVKKGACLIVIDSRETHIAKSAKFFLRPDSGMDIVWLNGLMQEIIASGRVNEEFIRTRTEGFKEFAESISCWTPERAELFTGLKAAELKKIAGILTDRKKVMFFYSDGIVRDNRGVDNIFTVTNLALLTGHIGGLADGINPLTARKNAQGACDMGTLPDYLSGYQSISEKDAVKKFEGRWGRKIYPRPGLALTGPGAAAEATELKALYIIGERNDMRTIKDASGNLEFLAVQDMFLSETAQQADVVFPSVSFAEKDGTFTSLDRRVKRIKKAIEPQNECKPDLDIICELAGRTGLSLDYSGPAEIMEEIAGLTPIYGGINYPRLEGDGLQWPCPSIDHPGSKFLNPDNFGRGKGRFQVALSA